MIFERIPVKRVLLGWNLPEVVTAACATECQRQGVELYLWQPLLTGDGDFSPALEWATVNLDGNPVPGHGGLAEFTFICPNHPEAAAATLEHLERMVQPRYFNGVFLDRIRYPSPANAPEQALACFCPSCQRSAELAGIDLGRIQAVLRAQLTSPEGRRWLAAGLLTGSSSGGSRSVSLTEFLNFRAVSITTLVAQATKLVHQRGLQVGLDCFTPTLAPMVGQDLRALSRCADWIKVMTYLRAYGPATIPFELLGMANWLVTAGMSEMDALYYLGAASDWSLPGSFTVVRYGGLGEAILTNEIQRARAAVDCELLAGIELVEMAGISELRENQIQADLRALAASGPDGLALSWDAWLIPSQRLDLVAAWT